MKLCGHLRAIPVRSITGEVLAGLCPNCHRQLGYDDLIDTLIEAFDATVSPARQVTIRQNLRDTAAARDAWEELTGVT